MPQDTSIQERTSAALRRIPVAQSSYYDQSMTALFDQEEVTRNYAEAKAARAEKRIENLFILSPLVCR